MRNASALALAVLLAAPAAASADVICAPSDSPTGFYACASVNLSWNAGQIYLDVANLGSWEDVAMTMPVGGYGYQILGVGFSADNLFAGDLALNGITEENGATSTGSCGGTIAACWTLVTALSGDLPVDVGVLSGPDGAIRGCNEVGGAGVAHYLTPNPCTSNAFIRFAFTPTGYTQEEFAAANFQWSLRGISGPEGASFKCGPTATLDGAPRTCTPTTTVPEPMSLVLLGTGLVGIAGVARRRRKNGDVTDA